MATGQSGENEIEDDPSDLKRKLAWRMAVAGLMILGLLAGLAVFDHLNRQSEPDPGPPRFTEAVPVAKKMLTQPVTPAEPAGAAAKDDNKPAAQESSAPPVDRSLATVAPPRPEVSALPALPRVSQPVSRAAAAPSPPLPSVLARPAEPRSLPEAAAPPKLFSGYALQAGVFADPRRAEELHARLTLEGIPSTIEARVQVGPFRNRAEAEVARGKLQAIGIDPVLLMPKGARR